MGGALERDRQDCQLHDDDLSSRLTPGTPQRRDHGAVHQ